MGLLPPVHPLIWGAHPRQGLLHLMSHSEPASLLRACQSAALALCRVRPWHVSTATPSTLARELSPDRHAHMPAS
jgi:hypothetical protein